MEERDDKIVELPTMKSRAEQLREEMGKELARIAEERGLDQKEVGERAKIHRRTVSNLFKGKNTVWDNYGAVCAALGISEGWLVSQAEELIAMRSKASDDEKEAS